jgi:hypothetical protein
VLDALRFVGLVVVVDATVDEWRAGLVNTSISVYDGGVPH